MRARGDKGAQGGEISSPEVSLFIVYINTFLLVQLCNDIEFYKGTLVPTWFQRITLHCIRKVNKAEGLVAYEESNQSQP